MPKISKLESMGTRETYSIEMAAPYHNYIVNDGLVSANSHSAAYALLAYQMAYLKTHFPIEFMTSQLTCATKDQNFFSIYLAEAKRMGIKILPPDINKSKSDFTIEGDSIRFSLSAIRDIGPVPAKELAAAAPFNSLKEIVDLSTISKGKNTKVANKKVLTALVFSGALSSFGTNPIDIYIDLMNLRKDKFDEKVLRESLLQTSLQEYERLYLSTNIVHNPLLGIAIPVKWHEVRVKDTVETTVIIDSIREIETPKTDTMAILDLITLEGNISAALFSKMYQKFHNLVPGMFLKVKLTLSPKGYSIKEMSIPKKLNKHLERREEEKT